MQKAEDAWNTRNPERVALAYTADSKWRNRDEFFKGEELEVKMTLQWVAKILTAQHSMHV